MDQRLHMQPSHNQLLSPAPHPSIPRHSHPEDVSAPTCPSVMPVCLCHGTCRVMTQVPSCGSLWLSLLWFPVLSIFRQGVSGFTSMHRRNGNTEPLFGGSKDSLSTFSRALSIMPSSSIQQAGVRAISPPQVMISSPILRPLLVSMVTTFQARPNGRLGDKPVCGLPVLSKLEEYRVPTDVS